MTCRSYFRLLVFVAGLMIFAKAGWPDDAVKNSVEDQKRAAQAIYDDLAKLPLRKIYVADFVDADGKRTGTGCYLAATFSKLFAGKTKGLAIQRRVDAHKYLKRNGWTDNDLSNRDVVSKLASESAAIKVVQSWRLEPSKDSGGSIVAARTVVEVNLRLY
jgi:hypothetical protein